MKNDFSINVQVNVGVTPELAVILNALVGQREVSPAPAAVAPVATTPQGESGTVKPEKTKKTKKPMKTEEAESQWADQEAEEQRIAEEQAAEQEKPVKEEEEEEKPADAEVPFNFTELDTRKAIDATRRRIIGENYKQEGGSEKYKRYFKALTATFIQIANFLGADKPSLLEGPDKIAKFIDLCDEITVQPDGSLSTSLPF